MIIISIILIIFKIDFVILIVLRMMKMMIILLIIEIFLGMKYKCEILKWFDYDIIEIIF